KGFAVVADEVRNLAGRSAEAAQSTANLITQAVRNADRGVTASEAFVATLEEVITGIDRMEGLTRDVAEATGKQSEGIRQINEGLASLDQIVQANAATTEQTASACHELSTQAGQFRSVVRRLDTDVAGIDAAGDGPGVLDGLRGRFRRDHPAAAPVSVPAPQAVGPARPRPEAVPSGDELVLLEDHELDDAFTDFGHEVGEKIEI
ncbi:hypothetical protein KDM41_16425, partial [bacterium]|nr:hypothetical protein [bacterium]